MAALPGEPEDIRRFAQSSFADLGWRTLRNDSSAQASMPPVDASLTFAHPDLGVALVDVAPDRAADPVERLRRRLEALETRPAFAAELPIVYLPLTAADLWRLNIILDSAFASPAPLPREEGSWVDVVQQALLPESFPPAAAESKPATTESSSKAAGEVRQARALRPWMFLGVAAVLLAGAAAIYGRDVPSRQASPAQSGEHAEAAAMAPDEPARAAAPPARMIQPAPATPKPPEQPWAQATAAPARPATSSAPPPQEASLPPRPPEAAARPNRITVHSVAAKRDVAEALLRSAAGAEDRVEFRTLRATLNVAAVRYFHESDKRAAEELAERLGPIWTVQDFVYYRPSPKPGSLEVWLPRHFRAG